MEETQPKIGKFSLNYGLILGVIGVIWGIMLFTMDAHYTQDTVNTVIGLLLAVGVTIWGVWAYRKANGGYLTLGQAVKLGAGIGLIAALIGIVYQLILSNVLDPDFASKVMDNRLAEAEASGRITSDQIQQQKEMGMKFFWVGYPIYIIFSVLIGLVIGLIGGLVLKKAKPDY